MKEIKLTNLIEKELKKITGGAPTNCDCGGCDCSCGGPGADGTNMQGTSESGVVMVSQSALTGAAGDTTGGGTA